MKKVCEVNNCVNNFKAFNTNYELRVATRHISSKFQQQPAAAEVLLLFISLLLLLVSQCRLAASASPYFTILCKICSVVAALLPAVVLLFSFLCGCCYRSLGLRLRLVHISISVAFFVLNRIVVALWLETIAWKNLFVPDWIEYKRQTKNIN